MALTRVQVIIDTWEDGKPGRTRHGTRKELYEGENPVNATHECFALALSHAFVNDAASPFVNRSVPTGYGGVLDHLGGTVEQEPFFMPEGDFARFLTPKESE